MKAQISYAEIEEIIRKKANINVELSYVSPDTIRVSKLLCIFGFNIKVALVSVNDISIEIGKLGLVGGKIGDLMFGNKIETFFYKHNLIEGVTFDENCRLNFVIYTEKIEKIAQVMETVEVECVCVDEDGVRAEFGVK